MIAIFVLLAPGLAAANPGTIAYTLAPVTNNGVVEALRISVTFRGEADGETIFELPNEWGGEEQLYDAISELQFNGASIASSEKPHLRVLKHKPRARITASYLLRQEKAGDPAADVDDNYRVFIRPTYIHLLGWAAFAHPQTGDDSAPATLRMRDLPEGWSYASDTEHRGGTQKRNLHAVLESVTVAGDFKVLSPTNGKAPGLRVAVRGEKWGFGAQDFADRVASALAEERKFFGDPDEPFLVTLLPLSSPERGWNSIGGTGLSDAFAMFSTEEAQSSGLTYVLAHEAMHTWVPRRIGKLGEPETADYWLSEGFTDFVTYRVLARSGLWEPADFAELFNEMLRRYAFSAERDKPNARIVEAFWGNSAVQKLPYQRGMLFALLLDGELLKASGGARDFDDIILAMRRKHGDGDKPMLAVESFREEARALGLPIDALLKKHIEGGEPIMLAAESFKPCGGVTTIKSPPFDRGFDIEATQAAGNVVSGIDRQHPAFAAGLRDGMKIVRREGGKVGDPQVEFVYRVKDGEKERVIRYMPQGKGLFDLQQLVLTKDLSGAALAACKRSLGGENAAE